MFKEFLPSLKHTNFSQGFSHTAPDWPPLRSLCDPNTSAGSPQLNQSISGGAEQSVPSVPRTKIVTRLEYLQARNRWKAVSLSIDDTEPSKMREINGFLEAVIYNRLAWDTNVSLREVRKKRSITFFLNPSACFACRNDVVAKFIGTLVKPSGFISRVCGE